MRGAKGAKWVAGAIVVAMAATACSGGGNDGGDKGRDGGKSASGGTFRLGSTEPDTIDAGKAHESTGIIVSKALYAGLFENTPDGKSEAKLAESATANDDCTTWTFKIKGGTKFSNGEPVDAEAFIRGWSRAASKELASDVAYHLSGIDGFKDVQGGKADTLSGLKAVDPNTLEVKLSGADCEFDKKTGHTVYSPMPKVALTDKNFGEAPIGNGPFKMSGKWEHNKQIHLVRNDDYGLEKAKLDKVEISLLNSANAQDLEYQGFQAGQFDYAHIPTPHLKPAKAKYEPQGKWFEKDTNGMNYLLPADDKGDLLTKDARWAIAYAIDQKAIAEGVFQGFQKPASAIVPPALPAAYQKGLCGDACEGQNPAKAKEFAAKAGLKPGTEITLAFNTGAGHEQWIQAVGKQLEDVLGLKVKLDGKTFPELLDAQTAPGAQGLFRFAWGADYPTPDNYLYPLLHTDSINKDESGKVIGDNRVRYSNPEFDKLVSQARALKDEAQRIELYKKAEKIAMDDMALIPMFDRTQYRLMATDKFNGLDDIDFGEDPILENISLKK
ncbi:ABC transporter substrate-binding protein [Streptomyces sp. CC228A]|uniref:peptide ABC transporter substrate-binding protein n=1 Tax=Streptomyces sp. CC228A TaxID=2898186 RepID=UPI001F1EAEDC|nr:ABC transporter substrate-binding protein [Streptomyces sp. CC228A]